MTERVVVFYTKLMGDTSFVKTLRYRPEWDELSSQARGDLLSSLAHKEVRALQLADRWGADSYRDWPAFWDVLAVKDS